MQTSIKIIQNTKRKGRRELSITGKLQQTGEWTHDDIAAALLSLEVKANGVLADVSVVSQRVHVFLD